MTLSAVITLLSIVATILYGVGVFRANPRRRVNRVFLIVCVVLGLWLSSVWKIIFAHREAEAMLWIRWASTFASAVPVTFLCLRYIIMCPDASWARILKFNAWALAANAIIVIAVWSPSFVQRVILPDRSFDKAFAAEPVYGVGLYGYAAYLLLTIGALVRFIIRDVRVARGISRLELQYLVLGVLAAAVISSTLAIFIPLLTGSSQLAQYGAVGPLVMLMIIAHGIATRRAVDVHVFLQRITFYLLLGTYLTIIYFGMKAGMGMLMRYFFGQEWQIPALTAALVTAFSMTPAYGLLSRFARDLFGGHRRADWISVMQEASHVIQSVTTLGALLGDVRRLMARALDVEQIVFLLREGNDFVQAEPTDAINPVRIPNDSALVQRLAAFHEPLLLDTLERERATPHLSALIEQLRRLKSRLAVAIRGKDGLSGILLVGPRASGRIYDRYEQDSILALCDQLSIALENARLYTEVETARRYHETLLERLPSGVVAVNEQGRITVFNVEAQRLTGRQAVEVFGRSLEALPPPLQAPLKAVLQGVRSFREGELKLNPSGGDTSVPVRFSAASIRAADGRPVGALIVFYDLSHLYALERQLRQHQELARIGTFAAGLAHEIKNPLVTLKTFAQLWPDRDADAEFRSTFAPLLGAEIQRIDQLINQLLKLSRPVAPTETRLSLHALLDRTLELSRHRLGEQHIRLERQFHAVRDEVVGDAELLAQTFEHFYINAMEAMGEGTILVTTENAEVPWGDPDLFGQRTSRAVIRVAVHDTGPGVPPEDRERIFDPFFTRKATGTGLGLALVRRNILAHNGNVYVTNRAGYGAVFVVELPLAPEAAA